MIKKGIAFYRLLVRKKYSTLAGGMSFFLLINGGSFLFLLLLIARIFNVSVSLSIFNYAPEDVRSVINYLSSISNGSFNGMIFIITAIWGASNLFYHVLKSGEIIYEIPRKRYKFVPRIIAIMAMLIFLIFVITIISLLAISQYFLNFITIGFLKRILLYAIYLFVPFCFLVFINSYVPPLKVRIKDTIFGSLFTSIYWVIATYAFSLFLKFATNFGAIYGALAFVLVFLMWLYILVNGLIIGFIINYQIISCKERYFVENNNCE